MRLTNMDQKLTEQLKSMKLTLPEEVRQRVRSKLVKNTVQITTQTKRGSWSLRIGTIATAVAAFALFAGVVYEIKDAEPSKTPTATPASTEGYDYQKELGFVPMLPSGVPLPLTNTTVLKDIHSSTGDHFDFQAIYGSGTDSLIVAETLTSQLTVKSDLKWTQKTMNGNTVYESETSGVKEIGVNREGVRYTLIAREQAPFDMAQLESLILQLHVRVTSPPTSVHVQTHGEAAVHAAPFSVIIPKYIPKGFVGQPQMTSITTEDSFEQSAFTYEMTNSSGKAISITETFTRGQDPNAPKGPDKNVPSSEQPPKVNIAGHVVTIERNDNQRVGVSWTMSNGIHVELEGQTDWNTVQRIIESM